MLEDKIKSHNALVVMDVQRAALAYTGEDPAFLKRLSNAIATARRNLAMTCLPYTCPIH